MAQDQEPEVILAQRLAANEKSTRTKAFKKLRKYVRARSQAPGGGFTEEEFLRIWKGLFYCLWMQDKPVLQEELSEQISGLLHNIQNTDTQLLFLEAFLKTVKREWNGIDRLRLDKYYQLVRFVLRQTFEMMKRNDWEESLSGRVLQLVSAQLLDDSAPSGLLLHLLDIYLPELTGVGAEQLTADQNLSFILPFCRVAAKTKDRVLLQGVCSSLFSTIVDQAPFAIADLIKEEGLMEKGEEHDSGRASEGEESQHASPQKKNRKTTGRKGRGDEGDDECVEEDEDDEEFLNMDQQDTTGPVLQFDYGAVADTLFQLGSHTHTHTHNRRRLYKLVKTFRDLAGGVFPQDEVEQVSSDEDDDGESKRKRRKRKKKASEQDETPAPTKRNKGKAADRVRLVPKVISSKTALLQNKRSSDSAV